MLSQGPPGNVSRHVRVCRARYRKSACDGRGRRAPIRHNGGADLSLARRFVSSHQRPRLRSICLSLGASDVRWRCSFWLAPAPSLAWRAKRARRAPRGAARNDSAKALLAAAASHFRRRPLNWIGRRAGRETIGRPNGAGGGVIVVRSRPANVYKALGGQSELGAGSRGGRSATCSSARCRRTSGRLIAA